ncbi:MAG: D-alanine--D-alanine ligase [Gammaproteobacteria bacterium]|mgnify:CR=1 FL=1|jgi:D-alanine-D-alanine ligase|nr:D-alanine--D-alanine ligase [Gammaproteobacteria bacterium]MBT5824925.1 D-alanine--D-alanine ligase [Gammaproteobacteria bacterium]MBT6419100.1 D-alanine--D-alanine ligase [Gammaproteobacteria bacterium]MBT6575906.1 D-alanine--D-alanine ligase [Gammaproteobacteria bacterium]MBT7436520.1 D-alanine--D-alanine ligase [Gammaproteobacteria bacterium]
MKPAAIKQPADFGRVAVLMGGTAAEREVSLKSGNAVFQALLRCMVDVTAVDVESTVLNALQDRTFDRVVNMIHGRGGEDGVLQAVLDTLELPYTGSGVLASALSMDKLRTKLCWQGAGLTSPKWALLQSESDIQGCIDKLGFPVIVKPALEGSSLGMSKAETKEQLIKAWQDAAQYQCDVYAEAWVEGEEYTVGFLNDETLPIIRLETPNTFYDYDAKYRANTTQYHCPSGLSAEIETELEELSLQACRVIGVQGWGRVDVFIDTQGQTQLIEVNTVPGMTDHSLVPMAAQQAGLSFDDLAWRILETSFK